MFLCQMGRETITTAREYSFLFFKKKKKSLCQIYDYISFGTLIHESQDLQVSWSAKEKT